MKSEADFRKEAVVKLAEEICLAARTAPKGKGIDLLSLAVAAGDDIGKISARMKEIGEREKNQTFLRDAENIKSALAIVLIGTKLQTIGLRYCGFCGRENCAVAEKDGVICVYNPGDLGIAVGSAAAKAADLRLDNRVMYTVGKAVVDMQLLGPETKIAFGLPLSASGKNPFFDRK